MIACAWASAAAAQTAPLATPGTKVEPPPSQTRRRASSPRQTMLLTTSVVGGGANDLSVSDAGAPPISGFHTDADALVTYQRRMAHGSIGFTGRSVLRYAAASRTLTPMRDQGAVDLSLGGTRSQLRASHSMSYSPYYQFGALTEAEPSPLSETAEAYGDFANSGVGAFGTTTSVDLTETISRRDALTASYSLRRTTFGRHELDTTAQLLGGGFTHRLTRSLSLRTGYEYRSLDSVFAEHGSVRNHDLDLGLGYSRALSFSRRTTVSFSSGSSATPHDGSLAFTLTGNASLIRQIGRTWSARLAVARRVQLLEGFTAPVLTNAATTTVGGALGRRLTFSSSAGVSSGTVGVGAAGSSGYANWTATAGLRYAVSRHADVDVQYACYGHQFDTGLPLAPGVANELNRNGVRVSLTWRTPLLH